tara:strand:- start:257 stop:487 length:231 start_codon:yes stop_codon:yes gene_type:complete
MANNAHTTIEKLIEKNGRGEGTLIGVDGNAYSLMAYTKRQLRNAGWSREDITQVLDMAMSSDYNNVISTCMSVLEG